MSHRNAPLTPEGRRRLCERIDSGRPICHVAAEAGIARQTMGTWYSRWQTDGEAGLVDRSSRPHASPNQVSSEDEDVIEWLRRGTKLGPLMLVAELAHFDIVVAASTVHRALVRRGISRLRDLDVSGANLRAGAGDPDGTAPAPVVRYEHKVPGHLVHLDVKKLGRIPDGGGWRAHGKGTDGHRASKRGGKRPGYVYLHSAVDDCSRLAYTEELADEKGLTAASFWERAAAFFSDHGITDILAVLTDNGSCYRSKVFNQALTATGSKHRYTRPYRPQTNGKVERYNRTLAREWAYQQAWDSNGHRAAALTGFLHRYNYHRPHTALRGLTPVMRTIVVTDLSGFNT